MVTIPRELVQAIQAGDCVLWSGAGLGALAGLPGWEEVLARALTRCPAEAQPQLVDLLAQGRLRPVLSHLQRTIGDPLALVVGAADPEPVAGAEVLATLPWRACFATAYAEVLRRIFATAGQEVEVLSHREVHRPTLRPQARDDERPMILRTPPTGRSMRADRALFDLVEEVVRTRTILFFGFDVDDPDFAEILELLGRIGRGRRHFAWLGAVTEAEAEDLRENFAVEVVDPGACGEPLAALCALKAAIFAAPPAARSLPADLAALDLARALATVPLRADVAADAALTVEIEAIDRLVRDLSQGTGSLGDAWRLGLEPGALLRLGNVYLAHGRAAAASACYEAVRERGAGREYVALAGYNLALESAYAGRGAAAASGLRAAAAVDRSLSLVPSRLELAEVLGGDPTRLVLRCRDREGGERLELWVRTLAHPVGVGEQRRYHGEVRAAAALAHPGLWRVRGGFTDGQLFGVIAEPIAGEPLSARLAGGARMEVFPALRLTIALLDALAALHAGGLVHRDVRPEQILVQGGQPILAGHGFCPLIHVQRPALRRLADGYLAPERLAGEPATASSDVYAAAAVLYRCLTGRSPAGSIQPAGALVPGGLDPRVDAVLARALSPDPDLRLSPRRLRAEFAGVVSVPMLLVSRLGAAP